MRLARLSTAAAALASVGAIALAQDTKKEIEKYQRMISEARAFWMLRFQMGRSHPVAVLIPQVCSQIAGHV